MTWRLASLLGRHGGDYGSKDIQVLHYVICPSRILNRACISISNLPENIAWQTHKDDLRLEARGPLKSGAWGGHPTCHPQTPPLDAIMVKESCNRSSVSQRVPGGLGSQIFMTSSTWRWWGHQTHAPAAFTPGMFLVFIFTRGWVDPRAMVRSEGNMYVTEKSSDTTGNRSRDRPTSSTVP